MRALIIVFLATATLAMSFGHSDAASCHQLWVARNSIYKAAGYCFKTARAIAFFGNAGCRYDDEGSVPLSRAQRRAIANIVAEERRQGCSD